MAISEALSQPGAKGVIYLGYYIYGGWPQSSYEFAGCDQIARCESTLLTPEPYYQLSLSTILVATVCVLSAAAGLSNHFNASGYVEPSGDSVCSRPDKWQSMIDLYRDSSILTGFRTRIRQNKRVRRHGRSGLDAALPKNTVVNTSGRKNEPIGKSCAMVPVTVLSGNSGEKLDIPVCQTACIFWFGGLRLN
jgi:hypothetical protein